MDEEMEKVWSTTSTSWFDGWQRLFIRRGTDEAESRRLEDQMYVIWDPVARAPLAYTTVMDFDLLSRTLIRKRNSWIPRLLIASTQDQERVVGR